MIEESMFLIRVIVSIAVVVVGAAIVMVGVAIARDYRHLASNRYESFVAFKPLGRRSEKLDFASYKRYLSLPWICFGFVVLALGINGLAHL